MKIEISQNSIVFQGKRIEFEVPIHEVEQAEDAIYIVLSYGKYTDRDRNKYRNIIALELNGDIRWRIAPTPLVYGGHSKPHGSVYVGVDSNTGDSERPLVVYDINGSCWKVDPKSGKVSDPIFTR
jgi:hypothetical protein